MSFNICALSGKFTTQPVICRKNGLIFDKDLIMNYISTTGICPITSIPLTTDDILDIDNANYNPPRSTEDSSINGLFNSSQQEMNDLIGEIGELKQKIIDMKKELTYESYKYEASINVINNLIQEKELANIQLEKYREKFKKI